jgi:hypothetical protein
MGKKSIGVAEPLITSDIMRHATKYEKWLGVGNTPSSKGDPSKISGIKCCIAFYDLPCFEVQVTLTKFYEVGTLQLKSLISRV